LPNQIQRVLLTGDYQRGPDGSARVDFSLGRDYPLPRPEELTQALELSEKAIETLDRTGNLQGEEELIRREWLAGALLGACACRRALAFLGRPEAGPLQDRRQELCQAIDLMDAVWQERNRSSDWPGQLKTLRALIDREDKT
jgi:hypothetical protein